MLQSLMTRLSIATAMALTASGALAAPAAIDTANPINGLTSIFSATFDGALPACGGGATVYCAFFNGDPPAFRNVTASPYPSKSVNNVPGGIGPAGVPVAPVPAAGSFLDLTLGGGNTTLTLDVSSITFGEVDICIANASSCATLLAHAVNAGIVLNGPYAAIAAPLTPAGGGSTGTVSVPVDANGKAVFQVQNAGAIVADFSRFSQVVTVCTGAQCPLITLDVLNLDMVRYVLEIDYDPTFTSFTGRFIGQTGNASMVFATFNSVAADQDGDGFIDTLDNCPSNANADQADGDTDGRGNVCDNCSATANMTAGVVANSPGLLRAQLDADGDGYGNICDSDVNNSGSTTATDYSILRSVIGKLYNFSSNAARSDMNGSGSVTAADYSILRARIGVPTGPSGLACAGTIPCPPQ